MADAFLCDFARTSIGRYAGAVKDMRPDDLAAVPLRAMMARNTGVDYGRGLRAWTGRWWMTCISAATTNRLCGSGLDAVGTADRMIRAGDAAGRASPQ